MTKTEIPRVGVLGGTFDPIHRGHVELARAVMHLTGLSKVLVVPAASPPHKPARAPAPAAHREAMVRLALAGREGLELSTVELATGRVCYTIDTLRRLRAGPPPVVPLFILGLDSLLELTTWREWPALVREFDLLVVARPARGRLDPQDLDPVLRRALVELPTGSAAGAAWRALDPGAGGRIVLLPVRPPDVSSREVRARVAAGEELGGLVEPAVARYIHEQGLYRSEGRS